ncbi:hypothetical protein DBR39_03430 [Chryseobacterium sp. KBW03]|uniref:hypothetical protein n=1 Tax=Chryseobacterium sp. KBW03 TaxID=2153362 RepID=UPI000F59C83E|nr:hypothetical protein [Chryseobacterium sp. KBW03]RQO41679.1 hypothetical protein DBR39_03430 [Chryseobacterium sp. KBW03]
MHTTDTTKRYKIFSEEDWTEAVFDDHTQIEVYAKNMTFHGTEIKGNLLLRGEGCRFPELKHINGNLSIDADNCEIPQLETVEGHFKMHCYTRLDQLKKVSGHFKCIVDAAFKNLEIIGGYISVKNATVNAKNGKLLKTRDAIPINYQFQADVLLKDGIFDIKILGNNIVIPHREIRGKISVVGENISFPNLEFIHGSLKFRCEYQIGHKFTHYFPALKKLIGNLKFENTSILFPELQETSGSIHLENGSYVNFLALEKSGNIMLNGGSGAVFPVLTDINGNFQYNGSEKCYLNALQYVKGVFNTYNAFAPNIAEVGDLIVHETDSFEHLQKINGKVQLMYQESRNVNFKSLEYLGQWGDSRLQGFQFPVMKCINNYLYGTNHGFEQLAKNIYFKINNNIYLTKDHFIVSRMFFPYVLQEKSYPLRKLVAILKLRHSSFQNFETREYERQWEHFDTPFFTQILDKIESLWDEVKPMKYEEFFNTTDRNFKLFCFSYYGVGNLMEKLEAKKINEREIEVSYVEYDENGNENLVKKVNRYEVHEVENNKLGIFVWGDRMQHSYAVKCCCPSTKKEHWLWIEQEYKDDALTAIASTFRIHSNLIPHIKNLKRQGDLLICELKEKMTPAGEIRPLTASEYFNLLRAET